MIQRAGTTIRLAGPCAVEDAEALLTHLQDGAEAVDLTGCTLLHAACLQVLLAARVTCVGSPADPALAQFIAPFLSDQARAET